MHVISRKKIQDFIEIYPDSQSSLDSWYKIIRTTAFGSFNELRRVFPKADRVSNLTVFDIGGNKYRLIAAIHYNRNKLYIRQIMTHSEYDQNKWKKDIK